jgi:glutamyl-tRNA reductase
MHVSEYGMLDGAREWREARRRVARFELVTVGLDHRTAGVALREQLAFSHDEIRAALRQLTDADEPLLEQAAILSTCNRVELYGVTRSRRASERLVSFLARFHGLDLDGLTGAVYVHRGRDVALHLAATAAGIESLVLGEAQIQGQVRTALEHALEAGTAGPELRRLFESAVAAGRRVRSETAIGRGIASVPQAAVEIARMRRGTLGHSTVLLAGAGNMAELAAKQLVKRGVGRLLVLGRDPARALRLAERHRSRVISLDQLGETLPFCDVVIGATDAPHPIFHRRDIEQAAPCRSAGSPLLMIDLAVPRDVDPAVGALAGVELYTLDDLEGTVELARAQRRAELPAAYSVLRSEVARFERWLSARESVPA